MSGLYLPSGVSPARLRLERAGHAFAEKKRAERLAAVVAKRWRIAPAKQRRQALLARIAVEEARKRREALMAQLAYEAERRFREVALRPTMASILETVSRRSGVSKEDILSPRRNHKIVVARYECFWLCREKTTQSFPQIGRFFRKDHSTVIYGAQQHAALRGTGEVQFDG